MQTNDFSQLPLAAQQSIRNQMLLAKMNSYGKERIEVVTNTGRKGTTEANPYLGSDRIGIVKEFIELEKGCELWIEGEKYPMRFCLNNSKIDTIHRFKKLIPTLLRKPSLLSIIYFYFNWERYLQFLYMGMRDVFYTDPKYYSQPVREVHRVFTKLKFDDRIRDVGCGTAEFDTSYRYRPQDVLVNIDKEAFYKNPSKELQRLIEIYLSREPQVGMKSKMKFIKYIPYILKFNGKLKEKAIAFVRELDIEEIKSSPEDLYWQNGSTIENDYMYRGKTMQERNKEYLAVKAS